MLKRLPTQISERQRQFGSQAASKATIVRIKCIVQGLRGASMIVRHVANAFRHMGMEGHACMHRACIVRRFLRGISATALLVTIATAANGTCPTFHTLTNGTTADASQVMDNFNYILGCPNFTGDVGIGTATPGMKLDVRGNLKLGKSGSQGAIYFDRGDGAYQASVGYDDPLNGNGDQFTINNAGGGAFIRFTTGGNVEKMRIEAGGNVGIGTTSPGYKLQVNGSVAGASAYNNLSDLRLKKKISTISGALATIGKLRGVRFTWRTPQERTVGKGFNLPVGEPQVGFIAQEVKAVLPEAVSTADGKDAVMSTEESKIVPVLVEAVKALKAANDNQSVQIKRLLAQVSELRRKVGVRTAFK